MRWAITSTAIPSIEPVANPHIELEADEFAGFVLHKLGATLKESQEVMLYISTNEASKTHPAAMNACLPSSMVGIG